MTNRPWLATLPNPAKFPRNNLSDKLPSALAPIRSAQARTNLIATGSRSFSLVRERRPNACKHVTVQHPAVLQSDMGKS